MLFYSFSLFNNSFLVLGQLINTSAHLSYLTLVRLNFLDPLEILVVYVFKSIFIPPFSNMNASTMAQKANTS